MANHPPTKEKVEQWLLENAKNIQLLVYSGHPTTKSSFKDTNRNVEFQYRFDRLKQEIKKDPLYQFGATKEEMARRRAETNLKKYGSISPLGNKQIKNKADEKIKEIYGVENVFLNKDIQQKIKETNLKKYGVENQFQIKEIQELGQRVIKENLADVVGKRKETSLERYGFISTFARADVQQKIKETIKVKYEVDNIAKSNFAKNKTKETNLKKFEAEYPLQNPAIKMKMQDSLEAKTGFRNSMNNPENVKMAIATKKAQGHYPLYEGKTVMEWWEKIKEENDISYIYFQQLCRKQGFEFAINFKKEGTILEEIVKIILKKYNIQFEHDRFLENGTNHFRPDFIIKSKKLIIECDGLYWHCDNVLLDSKYHKIKKEYYKSMEYDSLFFREDEILTKKEIIESIILNKLNLSKKLNARSCSIVCLSKKDAKKFFETNHLMGNGSGNTLALLYNSEVVAALQIRWVSATEKRLDVSRFCTKNRFSVRGGVSRLLKQAIKINKPNILQTFIDQRYGSGDYLSNFDFKLMSNNLSFKWFNKTNGSLFSRQKYHSDSGYENNCYKIWDCGQARWDLVLDYADPTKWYNK